MKKTLLTLFIVTALSPLGFSQSFDKAKLDSYFQTLADNNKFMGSVAVSKNGELLYTHSVGYADVENQVKATANTKYRIGSISKTFTAVLILKAVEENKLALDQTLDQFYPTIKNAEQITIKNLLNHRSGIFNFTNLPNYLTWNTELHTEEQLVSLIASVGSVFEPNAKAEYSNSNYVLLSFILEKTYQKSYADLLDQYIITPLDLQNTSFGGKIDPQANESLSYKYAGNWELEAETDMSIPLGAGGIISTPSDLTKFADALFNGKLISMESVAQMKTLEDQYGLGLFPIPYYQHLGYGHTGGIDGFASVFSHFPAEGVTFAMTSNGANYITNNISIAVLSAVFDRPYDIPTFSSFEVDAATLEQYVGVYASAQIPLKITITKSGDILMAQVTGQPAFPLEATSDTTFVFEKAGVHMEFDAVEGQMIMKQNGMEFVFVKE